MSGLAFTADEWNEFLDGYDDPNDAFHVADQMFNRERKEKLEEYQRHLSYCKKDKDYLIGKDLLDACFALYTGNTNIYRETMNKLIRWMYDHGYRPCGFGSEY